MFKKVNVFFSQRRRVAKENKKISFVPLSLRGNLKILRRIIAQYDLNICSGNKTSSFIN